MSLTVCFLLGCAVGVILSPVILFTLLMISFVFSQAAVDAQLEKDLEEAYKDFPPGD